MTNAPYIVCIGSVLWDVIGRTPSSMRVGSDVPGRITRLPGGVAMNIALALVRAGVRPELLTALGQDDAGDALLAFARAKGMGVDHVYRSPDLPTDTYMAIEGAGGLIAAIADAHSLEAAGARILTALTDGTLGSAARPFAGTIALDGNLTETLLQEIAKDPAFAKADLRLAPASPGKALRLLPLIPHPGVTLYLNLEEASLLCGESFASSAEAAEALAKRGATRVLITNGGQATADLRGGDIVTSVPPEVMVTRVTGAGDTFMAAHIVAEARGADRANALESAQNITAFYVSGETPL